jgi:hypothetical protein
MNSKTNFNFKFAVYLCLIEYLDKSCVYSSVYIQSVIQLLPSILIKYLCALHLNNNKDFCPYIQEIIPWAYLCYKI